MASLHFDGDLRRIYEVPELSTFTVDGSGYRVYVPADIPSAKTAVTISAASLWSRWVDYHSANKWTTLAFQKTGGAFRFTDDQGNDVFATFDLRFTNDWQFVPADYAHRFTILGNVFENLPAGTDFDTTRITSPGVSPRIFFSDSLQVVRETVSGGSVSDGFTEQDRTDLAKTLGHARSANMQTQKNVCIDE